ncbi:hypothetical protein AB0K92_01890 [Streptomyces sp. NPDC052687]|uniref:hypothetical protein n=1 Tax=Streptomyces sp. NPDC052687 TaxID=3154759 RepID=UPI00344A8D14
MDGTPFLAVKGFWAACFLSQGIEDEDLVFPVFEGEGNFALQVHQEMRDEGAWPTFRIPAFGGRSVVVVFRDYPEDDGTDYVVDLGQAKDCVRIAAVEGHFMSPGVSWDEVEAIANAGAGPLEQAQRMLLLAPMYADGRHTDQAAERFARALREVGAAGAPEDLARLLTEGGTMWEEPEWFTGSDGAWTCEGELSFRNPEGHSGPDLASRLEVDRALRG